MNATEPELSFDLIVVGSGAAGFAAALAAHREGASVVMLEREASRGGTTAKSGGQFWIPNNRLLHEHGIEDPRDAALRYMARLAYPALYDPSDAFLGIGTEAHALIAAFFDNAAEVLDSLTEMGAIAPVLDMATPSYHADLDDERVPYGRSLLPEGMPKTRADGTGGDALIRGLQRAAVEAGIPLLLEHRVLGVRRNEESGAVIGVDAQTPSGSVAIDARRGVVFCSGGFLHDRDLARTYLRGPVFGGCAAPGSTGDFLRIGIEVGASLGNMSHAWWNQCVLEQALAEPSTVRDVWLPFGDSMIQVNRFGRRVVNEKMTYNERAQVHFAWDASRREYSNLLLFMVYDDAVAQNPTVSGFRDPIPLPGETSPHVISGSTWEQLADRLDARLATFASRTGGLRLDASFAGELQSTVARFNGFAEAGYDSDFHRGETTIQQAWGGSGRPAAKATMHPFRDSGPYHCVILAAGSLDTKGGPRTNPEGQVLDVRGEPIPGLFGAGNCVASPAGQAYWAAGGTIGPALTFGYLAGTHAARAAVLVN